MKRNGIFIDYRNNEQVEWWNNVASKLVGVSRRDILVKTATNEPVGMLLALTGPFKDYVIKKNEKFISNPKTISI